MTTSKNFVNVIMSLGGKLINSFLALFLTSFCTYGQNTIGFPDVTNYAWQDYKAGLQNWDIKLDNNGVMYFANNEGLLTYDGTYWDHYSLPHKTIARSLEIGNNGYIYIGGQDEIGYFLPDQKGTLIFHNLIDKIPMGDRTFGDVWDILIEGESIYFRTNDKIFQYTNNSILTFKAPSEWTYLFAFNHNIYAQDQKNGLMVLSKSSWVPCLDFNQMAGTNCIITGSIQWNSQCLISTLKNGLFYFNGTNTTALISNDLNNIKNQRIYTITKANDYQITIGTSTGGIYIIDANGYLIQHFSIKEGLQNNNVLSTLTDRKGNIWLGLDNGVDCISYNSPIKHIVADEQESSGYTAMIKDSKLFIGTSSGLYQTELQKINDLSFSKGSFQQVNGSSGQVWGLADIQGHLMMGHHEGLFDITNNNAKPILSGEGCWNLFQTTDNTTEDFYVGGFYKGIRFFNLKDGQLISSTALPNFLESSRYLATDAEGNIWVSHPYHGVFQIQNEGNANQYKVVKIGKSNGLPETLNTFVFKIKNQIVAATEKGVYSYNKTTKQFSIDSFFVKQLGNQSIRYLKEDAEGNIWFIHEKKMGVIDISGNNTKIYYISDLDNRMLSGFEYIYPVNASNILLGGEKGFYHINYKKYKSSNTQSAVRLHKVKIFNVKDSTVYGGFGNKYDGEEEKVYFDYDWKNIHFEFSSPEYGNKSKTQFSYCLQGYDYSWSEWSEKTEKDYTNLPPGTYVFQVKSRNNLGIESKIETYCFVIRPPWYRTIWAYFLYLLIGTGLLGAFYMRQKKKLRIQRERHLEEKKKTNYLHRLEKDKAESELITLRNEKLQTEIDFKNSELANTAMHLLQKGELIAKIKAELTAMMKKVKDENAMNEIKKMIRALSDDEHIDEDWEHFAQHFDKVHSDFTQVLMNIHPNITPNDVKLCTYLRMNLSSKEISRLMNISVRGVELSRYRLRKKMGLSTETNLVDYLMKLNNKKSDPGSAETIT